MSVITSLGLFSTLPVPPTLTIDRAAARSAIAWFPATGAIIGACGGLVAALPYWLGQPLLGSVMGAATIAWVTGGLHLDGIADTADGLGSRKPPAEGLAIMKRSDIGPMGVAALVFVVLLGVASLTTLATQLPWWGAALTFVAAGAISRTPVLGATTPGRPNARPGGFGALFHGVTRPASAVVIAIVVVTAIAAGGWLINGWLGAAFAGGSALAALAVGAGWERRLSRHFGGMTGDLFGSIIDLTATAFLVIVALATSF